MRDLSVSQSYLICALNKNGKLSTLCVESPVCLLAGGVIDLIFAKSIAIGEDKKICIIGELGENNQYLSSLYTYIKESKPLKVEDIAANYAMTFSDKRLKTLIQDVGTSLVTLGYATAEQGGLLGKTLCFVPDSKIVDNVIQSIRAELLEKGTVSDNIVALVSLMEKSNQIKNYFSKHEKDELKLRLKEIKDSDSNRLVKEMIDYIEAMIVVIAVAGTAH